jgi:hypothetical protein
MTRNAFIRLDRVQSPTEWSLRDGIRRLKVDRSCTLRLGLDGTDSELWPIPGIIILIVATNRHYIVANNRHYIKVFLAVLNLLLQSWLFCSLVSYFNKVSTEYTSNHKEKQCLLLPRSTSAVFLKYADLLSLLKVNALMF